jgi:O-succinylhomoserine sulfhydrylase
LSKSLETLAIRLDRQKRLKVAEFLENHPQVNKVKYPFEIASSI